MCKLEKRVAVITGAASGIGKAISLLLAHNGYFVFLFDKDQEKLLHIIDESFTADNADWSINSGRWWLYN
ncbi:3-ketoacyl-(acyl-carrier-protein) reductase [Sporomusa ovata DSM 2662]|uniref:3-oxoacyl-[acyl-carrier protein] reductase n=1 Tax=Sporomusa ovata TaxID=2378 RepID=A0A0U1KTV4_9FIRM|nr:SDR family NAD(P)-dependent oxidoreductase [Sporomusa ovata]EQB26767.1 hypothetical protein SOV_3c06410 [Sporomusa ovata DSM 2662]CQR70862.1 hypothetical protein SpAn4DRAFT_1840 [Sporomusa ovata]